MPAWHFSTNKQKGWHAIKTRCVERSRAVQVIHAVSFPWSMSKSSSANTSITCRTISYLLFMQYLGNLDEPFSKRFAPWIKYHSTNNSRFDYDALKPNYCKAQLGFNCVFIICNIVAALRMGLFSSANSESLQIGHWFLIIGLGILLECLGLCHFLLIHHCLHTCPNRPKWWTPQIQSQTFRTW